MDELFPVLMGICIGLVVQRIAAVRRRNLALVGLSILAGFTASYISGELFVSWDFLLFDIPLVFLAAGVTMFVFGWQRALRLSQ